MFNLLKKEKEEKKEIQDLKLHSVISKDKGIKELRRSTEILFIDDEKLDIIKSLGNYKYNITHKEDIDSINDAYAYDIILCDVRGVGKKFSDEFEGAFLIREIKANYPNKIVIAYTGSTYDPSYNEYLKEADQIMTKGKRIDEWVETLDGVISKAVNPAYQWKKTRDKLLANDIRISMIATLENEYVKSIENSNFESFEKLVKEVKEKNNDNNLSSILDSLISSLIVKIIKEWN